MDDAAFEAGVTLVTRLQRLSPQTCFSIENPRGDHFPHLPGVRRLLRDRRWNLVSGSHCKCAGPFDRGDWPQKDTDYLVSGVGRNFRLPLCEADCRHLVPGTGRHKVVICGGNDLPSQRVLRDPMEKGMIPLGVFHRIHLAHLRWLARRHDRLALKEANVHVELIGV